MCNQANEAINMKYKCLSKQGKVRETSPKIKDERLRCWDWKLENPNMNLELWYDLSSLNTCKTQTNSQKHLLETR